MTHLNRGAPLPASLNSDDNDPAGNSTSPQGNPNDSPPGIFRNQTISQNPHRVDANIDIPALFRTWFQEHILEDDVKKLPIRLWTADFRAIFSPKRETIRNFSMVYVYLIKCDEPISAYKTSYSKFLSAAKAWLGSRGNARYSNILKTAIELANTEHNKPLQRAADGHNGAETG